jgi:hypothetical protein
MKRTAVTLILTVAICAMASTALAYTEPSPGSFGYEVYEFMDSGIVGALGVAIAMGMMAYCIYFIFRSNLFGAIPCAIAALMLIKIKTIVFSIGVNL